MRRTAIAGLARRIFSWTFFLATLVVAAPAFADGRVEREAKALQKKAIEEDNLNVNYAAASKKLQTAVNKCGAEKCNPQLKASLLRDLGAMQLLAGNVDAGRANFALAVKLDGSLDLDPAYKNPMLEGIWADVKSKGGGGGGGGAPAGAAPASGDFTHTPPSEALVKTPLALYVEYPGTEALGRVIVKYKGSGDWKTLQLKKLGDGFGATIPCADVALGTITYYIQGFDTGGQAVAMSGSRTAPYSVEVKTELLGPVPSLPGKSPPSQCKDKSSGGGGSSDTECPPDFPGCNEKKRDVGADCDKDAQCGSGTCVAGKCAEQNKKAGGDACENDDECQSGTCSENKCSDKKGGGEYCENDNECTSGSCNDSKCAEAKGGGVRRIWVGIAGQLDLYLLPAATDVCLRTPGGLNLNTAGYTCIDPGTSAQFPSTNDINMSIQRGAAQPNTGGGLAVGNIRALATFDYLIGQNIFLGARLGYVARTDPAVGTPGSAFPPLHVEARFTYLFGAHPVSSGVAAFMVFGAVGLSEFDSDVAVTVQTSSPPPTSECSISVMNPNVAGQTRCSENAWRVGGPFFAAAGAGVRIRLGDLLALPIDAKLEGAFGGRAGFTFGIAPELGLQLGF